MLELPEIYAKAHLELAFQRHGGIERNGGWTDAQGENFIINLMDNYAMPELVLADIETCLRACKAEGFEKDKQYFQNLLDEGKRWISVDGNNTSSYLTAFLEDRFKVKNTSFSELDEIAVVKFKSRLLTIKKIEYASLKDIAIIFQNLNRGMRLNAQEMRNGHLTELSDFVRECSKDYNNLLSYCWGSRSLEQRAGDEFVAKAVNFIINDYKKSNKAKDLDQLYEEKSNIDKNIKSRIESILQDMQDCCEAYYSKVKSTHFSSGKLSQFFMYIDKVTKNYEITDHFNIMKNFEDTHDRLIQQALQITEQDRKEHSYTFWVKEHHQDSEYFQKRLGAINESFICNQNFAQKGWVREKRKNFTPKQKRSIAEKQAWLDPITGKQFGSNDLDDYEVDHKVPLSKGGTNKEENLQLLKKEDNRKKGALTMEEYKQSIAEATAEAA
tara:strand:- start:60 stop:1382 length:1323 start_codon:yes stop_codon:yes gene_type:complete